MTAAAPTAEDMTGGTGLSLGRLLRRNAWVVALYILVAVLLVVTRVKDDLRP